MEGNQETDSLISMEILLDKLIAIESRMQDNFSNLHTRISELTCEFKHEINVVKSTLNDLEKSVNHAWANIEDLQQESKALKDSKTSHQKMMDEQTAELKKLQAENEKLKAALKEAQENLVALWELLAFHEHPGKSRRKLLGYHLWCSRKWSQNERRRYSFPCSSPCWQTTKQWSYSCLPSPYHRKICRERRQGCCIQCQKPAQVLMHPDTVKPILHKTLHEKSRKKGKSLFNPCSLLEKLVASRR